MKTTQRLFFLLGFAGFLAAAPGVRALDFTPHTVARGTEQFTCFLDGETKHVLRSAEGVTVFGEKGETTFLFKGLEGASLTIKPSPVQSGAGFGEAELTPYRQALVAFLPKGAQDVLLKKEEPFPLNSEAWSGYQFIQEYKIPGRTISQSVTYVNLTGQPQFVLIVTAPAEHFKAAQEISFSILRSWHIAQPGEDPTYTPPV